MYSIDLPSDLGYLLLTPQTFGLPGVWQTPFLAALVLVPVALVLGLYRYEMQLVARTTALALLVLRVAALALLLLLVCLQPIYGRTHTDDLPGRVLVTVDRSESTNTSDARRPIVEKLRLARALHWGKGICSDAQLDEWIEDYEQQRSPKWLKPGESREAENQRRATFEKLLAFVDATTRAQTAQRILEAEGGGLLRALMAKHEVELLGFHREAWDLQPDQLEELFRTPSPASEKQDDAENLASFTDLSLPFLRALERSGPGQGKILGIVLLTDGQHNSGEAPTDKARELGERHIPIYPIALGSRLPPPDAALVSIQAPNTVFKDVDTVVEAGFKINGMEAQDFQIELHRRGKDGDKVLAKRLIHHEGKDRIYSESFPVRMEEAGTQMLSAEIHPVRPGTKETRIDNNSRSTTVNVADDKASVLLLDGEARWEYHYLATALKRDRTLKVESVMFQQPRLNQTLSPDERKKSGLPSQQLSSNPDALADFDCIVLGDVAVEDLPLEQRQRLEKYVAERGGTLVILAGKRYMPLGYPEIDAKGETDPLRKLLPLDLPRAVTSTDGFRLELTSIGRETKFMEMDADPAKSAAIWHGLPRHYWAVVGQAKPGATTLAYVPSGDERNDASEGDKQKALIVKQNYGFGRVLFVGLDSTWRWRYRAGDAYHHTFWGAVLRWAASDKPLMTGNDFIRFGTSQPIYARGEDVKIVVRLNEELGPLPPNLLAAARIILLGKKGEADKVAALVPLARRSAQPRVLEGPIRDLPPGDYALELDLPDYADKLLNDPAKPSKTNSGEPGKPMRAQFLVKPPESKENIDLETRWPLLEELAAKSGGKVFAPEEAGALIDLLVHQSVPYTERIEQKLWQWWGPLALVLTLLTIEWVARKLAGLP
jgi:hypothetical protein